MLAFAFTRKDKNRSLYFSMLTVAVIFYTLGYLLEIHATTTGEAMMALRIENIGIPFVTPFCLLTALSFFQPRMLRPWITAIIALYGTIMVVLIFFTDLHSLYYSSIDMVYNGTFYAVKLGKGPLYYIQQIISISSMILIYVLLAARYRRGSTKLRHQMNYFIIGSLLGVTAHITYLSGVFPMGIDPMPLSLAIGLIFFAVNLYKHKLLDIIPVAFDSAIKNMDDAAIVLDSDWCFIYCNQKAKELFPSLGSFLVAEEIIRAEGWPLELCPKSEKEVIFDIVNPVTKDITKQQASINEIYDKFSKVIGVSIVIRDITEVSNMLRQLEALAITDHLTGIFNRRHFMTLVDRQLSMAQRHGLPVSILMLDIDHFKNINDTYGHIAGDHVLCEMVRVIERQMRIHDVIARYGGEEFIILSEEKDEFSLMAFANRLRRAIENETIIFEGSIIKVTASFGAAMIMPGQSFSESVEVVDRALYEAKNSGRNRVVFGRMQPGKKP